MSWSEFLRNDVPTKNESKLSNFWLHDYSFKISTRWEECLPSFCPQGCARIGTQTCMFMWGEIWGLHIFSKDVKPIFVATYKEPHKKGWIFLLLSKIQAKYSLRSMYHYTDHWWIQSYVKMGEMLPFRLSQKCFGLKKQRANYRKSFL